MRRSIFVQFVVVIEFVVFGRIIGPDFADRLELLVLVFEFFQVSDDGRRRADPFAIIDEFALIGWPRGILKVFR